MSSMIDTSAFDRATDPVLGILSPVQAAEIVNYHADEALQERIETLAHRANEGELSEEERAEYEGYIQANQVRRGIAGPGSPPHHSERSRGMITLRRSGWSSSV